MSANPDYDLEGLAKKNLIPRVKLTPDQDRQLDIALALLLYKQPFFGTLLMQKLDIGPTEYPGVPVAATDEFVIWLNANNFFMNPDPVTGKLVGRYGRDEQVFILCHEVLHCALNHCTLMHKFINDGVVFTAAGVALPYVDEIMQHAADYVINAILRSDSIGKFPEGCLYDEKLTKNGEESVVEVYEKIWKSLPSCPNGPGGKDVSKLPGGGGSGPGYPTFDKLLTPGESSGNDPAKRTAAEWAVAVQGAIAAAKSQGNLPAGIERLIGQIMEPKVPWQEHIKSTLHRRLGSDGYDWTRADRRLITRGDGPIYFASQSSFSCGTIVVGVDTSGSIGESELNTWFGEMAGIMQDLNPRELVVMFCDAAVHRVDILEEVSDLETTRAKGAPGGGGTSFVPVFDKIAEMGIEPDALVYLTDMYGAFPDREPKYPVIWGKTTDVKAPWGDEVRIEL